MSNNARSYIFIIISLILLLFSACGFFSGAENPSPTVMPTSTSTPTLSPTPTASPTPTVTSTPTPSPEALIISEMMASNKSYVMNGALCDWIELYNAGDEDLNLSAFFLSDKENKPLKAKLPEVLLKSHEYIVLTCDSEVSLPGSDEKKTIPGDLALKLSNDGETVTLTRADGLLIDKLSYESLESDYSVTPEGKTDIPSPGFSNDLEGHKRALAMVSGSALSPDAPGLIINELLSSNNKYAAYTSSTGLKDYYELVELFNASNESIRLSDYYLSDSSKRLLSYRLPDITLEAGKYVIIYCVGRATKIYDTPTALFKYPESPIELSYFGETLYLTRNDGLICDCVNYPELYDGVSYGRSPEAPSRFIIQGTATPGQINNEGAEDFSPIPIASVKSGAYKDSVTVEFTSPGTIYYTTDCSAPTTSSKVWDGKPITFTKTTTLRAISVDGDKLHSFESVYNYFINDRQLTLDVVSVSMSANDWKRVKASKNRVRQYAINIALYKNNSDENGLILDEEFSVNAGIELCGASSLYADKASYEIKFKSQFGPSKLNYKLFDHNDIEEFKSITLRSGSQDNAYTLMRDEIFSSLLEYYYDEEIILNESYRPVNLYVNNEYRGLYYIREHQDKDMIAHHEGVDPEDVVIDINFSANSVKGGSQADVNHLKNAINLIIYGNKKDPALLDKFCEYFDYDSFLTYWATQLWTADDDCHVRLYRIKDGKWTMALHDQDIAMRENIMSVYANNYFSPNNSMTYSRLLVNLLKIEKFRTDLLATIGKYCQEAYSPEFTLKYVQENFIDRNSHDMKYNCALWGGTYLFPKREYKGLYISTYATWQTKCNKLMSLLSNRNTDLIKALRKYVGLTPEEEEKYFKNGQ